MTSRRPSILATGAFAAAVLVAACGGSAATTAPASEAPAASEAPTTTPTEAPAESVAASVEPTGAPASAETGGRTGRIELTDDKVAITLPDGWVEVVLTGDDVDTILKAFPDGTFSDDQVAMMRTAIQSGISLMGFDGSGDGSNINVLVQDQAVPVALLEPELEGQLKTIPGASDITVKQSKALGEDALVATYKLTNTLADGSTSNMTGTQLYVSANDRLYILTVTLAADSAVDPMGVLGSLETLP